MRDVQPATWSEAEEYKWRMDRWSDIKAHGDPRSIPWDLIKQLSIYASQGRMYADTKRTKRLPNSPHGVTLSVLHDNEDYAEDLSESDVIYHHPKTKDAGRNRANVNSTMRA